MGAVVDVQPVILHSVPPVYPDVAQKAAPEVNVFLKFKVNVDGSVSDVSVLGVSVKGAKREGWHTDDTFRRPAIDAISKYRFIPAQQEGKPVPVWMTHQISFELPKQKAAPPSDRSEFGGDEIFEFWDVDVKPVVIHAVAPAYPDQALKAGLSGNVFLKFKVNVDGSVSAIRVLKGQPVFKQPAVDAISQFTFKPAEREGKPVTVWMSHVIRFGRPKPKAMPPPVPSNADGEKVFDISSVDVKPIVIHSVPPVYPEWARFTGGDKGVVNLKFKVNVDGSVTDVRVLNGRSVFVKSAVDAISQFRFQPGEREGKPVPVRMTHRISFSPPKPMATSSPGAGDAASENVFEFQSVDSKPVVIHSVQPVYPDIAKEAGLAGDVALKFKVNVDGTVSDVDAFVLKGGEIFRKPAIDAVKQFLYKPAEHDGEAVAVRMTHHFAFAPSEHQDEAATDSSGVEGNKVFEISEVHVMPVLLNLNEVQPDYPDVAKKTGLTGRVILKFKINVDGSVSDVQVLEGDEIFRKPAIDAVTRFRYKPAERDGRPVRVWMTMPFKFVLPEHQDDAVPETGEPGVGN